MNIHHGAGCTLSTNHTFIIFHPPNNPNCPDSYTQKEGGDEREPQIPEVPGWKMRCMNPGWSKYPHPKECKQYSWGSQDSGQTSPGPQGAEAPTGSWAAAQHTASLPSEENSATQRGPGLVQHHPLC